MQIVAVSKGEYFHIRNPTELVKEKIIELSPHRINFIPNPSRELQLKAIRNSNYSLEIILMCPDVEELAEQVYNEILAKEIIK